MKDSAINAAIQRRLNPAKPSQNYARDLNVMQLAESLIFDAQETPESDAVKLRYRAHLSEVCKRAGWQYAFQEFRAEAIHRAEAFLRTYDEWDSGCCKA